MEIDIRSDDVQRRIQSIAHYIVRIILYITINDPNLSCDFLMKSKCLYSKIFLGK